MGGRKVMKTSLDFLKEISVDNQTILKIKTNNDLALKRSLRICISCINSSVRPILLNYKYTWSVLESITRLEIEYNYELIKKFNNVMSYISSINVATKDIDLKVKDMIQNLIGECNKCN
tara:strand:- start:89 stop:445 length:357 start_codon:yes stop_codon:yes gene_type:complete